jgi:AAA+ ATPase superfamily predicted ATPase
MRTILFYPSEPIILQASSKEGTMSAVKLTENPFVVGKVVTGKDFFNRKNERTSIIKEIENHDNIVLFAPRRFGKTSLINQVFLDLDKKHRHFAGLYIDFFQINSKEKFLHILANEYAHKSQTTLDKLLKKISAFVRGISPVISLDHMGNTKISFAIDPLNMDAVFEDIMNLPAKMAAEGTLTAVFLDEFQEIVNLNGDSFQKELRAIIQHHTDVSYIFSGSKQHLFHALFNHRKSPLYNIGKKMHLTKMSEKEYLPFLKKHISKVNNSFSADHYSRIYQLADGIPYYVQHLANEIYNLCLLNANAGADQLIDLAKHNILNNENEVFVFQYQQLSKSAKKALDMVLEYNGKNLFSKNKLGRSNMAKSSLNNALSYLQNEGILVFENSIWEFQDSFFKQWLMQKQ